MQNLFLIAILITGASGMVAQLLLLRELLVTFYGNELTIGIILSNWVILEAAGAFFLGRGIERIKNKLETFVLTQIIFSVSFPIVIYLTRILKTMMGLTPGVGLGLVPIIFSSFLILLPVSLCHGALFTFGCKLCSFRWLRNPTFPLDRKPHSGGKAEKASSIGMVYVYETVGAIIGGIVFTYLLIPYLHSFQIALLIVMLNTLISVLLLGAFWQKGLSPIRRGLSGASTLILILCAFSSIFGWAGLLHKASISDQWRSRGVVHYQNSIYSNIVVTEREKQYTFYSDGMPIVTTPTPEITFVEEFANFPMLFHPGPEQVLIISGGAGGLINELLKHPVKKIDYVELDPLIIELIKRYSTPMTDIELSEPRVDIKNMDGRLFIKKAEGAYDVILMGLAEPNDLQKNRLFTEEFFQEAKKRLRPAGILAFTLPGSFTYLNLELRELNATVLTALKNTFKYTRVIPGDYNLFLSSDSGAVTGVDSALLIQRVKERHLSLKLFKLHHLNYRMDRTRLDWFMKSIRQAKAEANRDFRPLAVFYSLAFWNARFSPYFNWFFRGLTALNLRLLYILLFIVIALLLLLAAKAKRFAHLAIPFCIATSGFCGMMFSLLLIFSFQILYGYVYQQIGLLVTAFMAGAAIGGLVMTKWQERLKSGLDTFMRLEAAVILFSIVLPIIISVFSLYLEQAAVSRIFTFVFPGLCIACGLIVGLEFPLANRLYLGRTDSLSHAAGVLYGVDLLGGWAGGMVAGIVLLPLLGLAETCLLLAILKICSLGFLFKNKDGYYF